MCNLREHSDNLRFKHYAKVVVRIENYKVLEKLMLAVKPNTVINHLLDHLGDKKAVVRESVLNMIMFGLLTFPSNEFDLKNIAATVVPTLVDPKRRVRHAALEAVSILAAFLGPTKVSEDTHCPLEMSHRTILSGCAANPRHRAAGESF